MAATVQPLWSGITSVDLKLWGRKPGENYGKKLDLIFLLGKITKQELIDENCVNLASEVWPV